MVWIVIYSGDGGSRFLRNGVLLQDYMMSLPRNSCFCGRCAGKVPCIINFITRWKVYDWICDSPFDSWCGSEASWESEVWKWQWIACYDADTCAWDETVMPHYQWTIYESNFLSKGFPINTKVSNWSLCWAGSSAAEWCLSHHMLKQIPTKRRFLKRPKLLFLLKVSLCQKEHQLWKVVSSWHNFEVWY